MPTTTDRTKYLVISYDTDQDRCYIDHALGGEDPDGAIAAVDHVRPYDCLVVAAFTIEALRHMTYVLETRRPEEIVADLARLRSEYEPGMIEDFDGEDV